MSECEKFLSAVLAPQGTYCITTISKQSDGKSYARNMPFSDLATAIQYAHANANTQNVYFALSTYQMSDGKFRRTSDNTVYQKSFWLDLDCDVEKAKTGDAYADKASAAKSLANFLKVTGLPAPAIVDSGNGYHVYWILNKAISTTAWKSLALMFRKVCKANGLIADHHRTADAASILRMPGTYNHKHEAKPVVLRYLPTEDKFIDPVEFAKKMIALTKSDTVTPSVASTATALRGVSIDGLSFGGEFTQKINLPRDPRGMIIKCRQIREMATSSYPAWMLAARTILHTTGGAPMVHALSKLDKASYDHSKCQSLCDNLSADMTIGPGTCSAFESYCHDKCADCPFKGKINSPISLAEIASAPAVEMPKVDITTADLSHEISLGDATQTAEYMPYADEVYKVLPGKGIFKTVTDENGIPHSFCISRNEVYIHTLCVDNTQGSIPKRTYIMRKVVPDCAPVDIPFAIEDALGPQKIELWTAQCGLLPHPKNRKDFYTFMNTYIAAIQNKLPEVYVRDHFGWVKCTDRVTGVSYPGFIVGQKMYTAKGQTQVRLDDRSASVATKLGTKGNLKDWLQVPELYKTLDQKFAQLLMCTAFGAPLMKFGRGTATNVAYNFWDINGGKGKSSMLKAIASVWGDPHQMLMGRTDTHAARFQQYAVYRNLPILIDELTGINDDETASLLYDIVNGREKARSTASGTGLAQSGHWDTITIFTANQSMYESLRGYRAQSSATCMRLIEAVCDFKDYTNTDMALKINAAMTAARDNYGLAGARFIEFVMSQPKLTSVVENYAERFATKHSKTSDERFWLYGIAIPLVAGRIAKALGLLTYDMDALEQYCINELLPSLRAKVKVNKPTGTNLLMDFLNDNLQDTLIVRAHTRKSYAEQLARDGLKPASTGVMYGNTGVVEDPFVVQLPTRKLYIRRELDSDVVYISSRALSKWCKDHVISLDNMLQELTRLGYASYGLNTKRFALGKDVPVLVGGTQTVYVFRVEQGNNNDQ